MKGQDRTGLNPQPILNRGVLGRNHKDRTDFDRGRGLFLNVEDCSSTVLGARRAQMRAEHTNCQNCALHLVLAVPGNTSWPGIAPGIALGRLCCSGVPKMHSSSQYALLWSCPVLSCKPVLSRPVT